MTNTPDREAVYLADMVAAIEDILEYTRGGRKEFLADKKTRDAVVRNLEVLGEAAKRVPIATRDAAPQVP